MEPEELAATSRQLAAGYRAAYAGLMDAAWLDSLADDHWEPILQGTLDAGGRVLVARRAGEIVGSAAFGAARRPGYEADAELYAIYLLPGCIGSGLGRRLYARAEELMRGAGHPGCLLEVLEDNRRAIDFYRGQGFENGEAFTVEENGMVLRCRWMHKKL